jgi:peptidyl-prolyl cis-trans isomerase A (cyclophilin A)
VNIRDLVRAVVFTAARLGATPAGLRLRSARLPRVVPGAIQVEALRASSASVFALFGVACCCLLCLSGCAANRENLSAPGPRVLIQTALGQIELELDAARAPITVSNFLRGVAAGFYDGGQFHRTVTLANQPTNTVKIEVIQTSANAARTNQLFAPILLERTRDTGLKHRNGAISMARTTPDSAQDHFFICIGDQPELDFGGRRNPDGQGFAVFGKVVNGMEVVRKIHASPAEGQNLKPIVRIERAHRVK